MSHAFVPPNIAGHENVPIFMQLVINNIIESIVMITLPPNRTCNMLELPKYYFGTPRYDGFNDNRQESDTAYCQWTRQMWLLCAVGRLAVCSKWTNCALTPVVDIILAVCRSKGHPMWSYVSGSVSFVAQKPLTPRCLHEICEQLATRSQIRFRNTTDKKAPRDYSVCLEFPLADARNEHEWQVEVQVPLLSPHVTFTGVCWPHGSPKVLSKAFNYSSAVSWDELELHCAETSAFAFLDTPLQKFESPDVITHMSFGGQAYMVRFWSKRFRRRDAEAFCRALVACKHCITSINLEAENGLSPYLFRANW